VCVYDLETSTMRRPRTDLGCCATKKNCLNLYKSFYCLHYFAIPLAHLRNFPNILLLKPADLFPFFLRTSEITNEMYYSSLLDTVGCFL
jgi:hypothetical protein